jgi:DNA-binding transcriptional MerR regulator
MDLTIDQLAQRVGMTARNIREWQTQGLVPPPERRGRIGVYSDAHVAMIDRVKRLKEDGFPLDIIRRMIDKSGESETDVRQLAAEVLSPFATTGSTTMRRAELRGRLGESADTSLKRLGVVSDVDADTVLVPDITTLGVIENLVAAGISLYRLVDALVEADWHQQAVAKLFLDAYVDDVWQPFVESGFTSPGWRAMADNAAKARPLALHLLSHRMQRALDDVGARIMLHRARDADEVLDDLEGKSGRSRAK